MSPGEGIGHNVVSSLSQGGAHLSAYFDMAASVVPTTRLIRFPLTFSLYSHDFLAGTVDGFDVAARAIFLI